MAANGTCKASKGCKGLSEAVRTNGYDCKIFVLGYLNTKKKFILPLWLQYCLFVRDNVSLYLQTEMMSDAIDDALDNDEAEDETEELTNQVLPS